MSSTTDLPSPSVEQAETFDQTALACYLSTVVAIGNCMAEVCPSVGAMYRERLHKLPRRLGFDPTPVVLQQSLEAVTTDLLEFSQTATAWSGSGSKQVATLLNHIRETEETLMAAADLQSAFLDDLAEHITTSAELDDEAQLRTSFKRYASGLHSYAQRTRTDKQSAIGDLRRRREALEVWMHAAASSTLIDAETGFLNRTAAEVRIDTQVRKQQPFCAIVVARTEDGAEQFGSAVMQIMKDLGDKLAGTIRPYDVIFRWSRNQLLTIFEATRPEIDARVQQISGWLGDGTCPVEIAGKTVIVRTHTTVSVVEQRAEESASGLIARIEAKSPV